MKRYLDHHLPTKTLWRNLDSVEAKTTTENEVIFSPDQLFVFTSTQNGAKSNRKVENNAGSDVFNALHQIKCNRVG
jgi:hypothetical protein